MSLLSACKKFSHFLFTVRKLSCFLTANNLSCEHPFIKVINITKSGYLIMLYWIDVTSFSSIPFYSNVRLISKKVQYLYDVLNTFGSKLLSVHLFVNLF